MNPVATALVVLLLIGGMLAMGTSTTPRELKALSRRPLGLALALVVTLLLIPAMAFAFLKGLPPDPTTGTALMIVAAAPGGGTGALLSLHVRGDRAHAVALQVALAITSLVAVPVWLRVYAGPGAGEIDYVPLVASLVVLQWLPLASGLVLSARRPAVAAGVHPFARRFADLMLALLIVVLVATSGSDLDDNGAEALLGIGVVLTLTVLGGLAVWTGTAAVRRATTMTTIIRNLSLALAAAAFLDESDAAALVVLTYGLAMYLSGVAWVAVDRARPRSQPMMPR
jgi:BASS family bile acid:Na+ symporter